MMSTRVAVVTGGNKGIGFAVCEGLADKGFRVVLTSRSEPHGRKAAEELRGRGFEVDYFKVDVTVEEDIRNLSSSIEKQYGRLDALINNAGISIDGKETGVLNVSLDTVRKTFETNTLGGLRMAQYLAPLMRKNRYGRIVNMSSEMGQLSEMGGGYPGYRISKTALNAVTRILHSELHKENVLVNAMSPGWVRTDMGGYDAARSPQEGADTAVWLAMLPDDGPSGGFFRDRKVIAW